MKQGTKPRVKVNGRYVKMEVCPKFLRALREMGEEFKRKDE